MLKPGSYFCSYEWVATKEYDPNNEEHVRIIDEINFGNGLPVSASAALSNQCIIPSQIWRAHLIFWPQ